MNPRALFKRIIAVALCLAIMIPLCPVPASALTKGTAYVSATIAKVYKSKSTSSKKIGTTSFGQKVKCTSVSGKWAKVKNSSGQTGYMLKSELSNANTNTLKKTVYIQKDGLKVRQNASASSKVIGKLKLGSDYIAVAKSPNGRWLRIKNGSRYGYIQTAYTDTEPYKKGTKVYMTGSQIAVISSPNSFDTIGKLSLGQSCYLLKKTDDYCKVRSANGMIGYIRDPKALSEKNPNTLNKKMYVQASGTPYYPHAITNGRTGTLKKNTAVTAVAAITQGKMEWYRVKYNKKYYYIPGILLAESKAPSAGRTVYAYVTQFADDQDPTMPIYKKPVIGSDKVATVVDGTKLTIIGCKGTGVKVRTPGGKVGYVMFTQLRKSK